MQASAFANFGARDTAPAALEEFSPRRSPPGSTLLAGRPVSPNRVSGAALRTAFAFQPDVRPVPPETFSTAGSQLLSKRNAAGLLWFPPGSSNSVAPIDVDAILYGRLNVLEG